MNRPVPIGSPVSAITIGISRVACFAATALGVNPVHDIDLTTTISAASSGSRSICPSPTEKTQIECYCPRYTPDRVVPCELPPEFFPAYFGQ